jgi:uncharacterized protein
MQILTGMSSLQAASLYIGLITLLMMALKLYVGGQRGKLKVPSGDVSNPDFARAGRVQMNAVEDVPVLILALLTVALLGIPAFYIHIIGITLFVSRILHATGLAAKDGFSFGRIAGTIGTMLVFVALGLMLIVHAFYPAGHG